MDRRDEYAAFLRMLDGLYDGDLARAQMAKPPAWLKPLLRRRLGREELNAVLLAVLMKIEALDRRERPRSPEGG